LSSFVYRTSGLVLSSPLVLPELAPDEAAPDVIVRWGAVPTTLETPRTTGVLHQARPGQLLLDIRGVARYLVEDGAHVTIDRASGASDAEVRLFLLNVVLAVLLHQRGGLLPLHASALGVPGGAALFAGFSGAGKSTLAAEFVRRGHPLLSDDIAPLRPVNGGVEVLPLFPRLNLWADSARHFGFTPESLPRVRPEEEKYSVPVAAPSTSTPLSVRAVYVLTPHSRPEVTVTPLEIADAFKVLLYRTAGLPFLEGLGLRPAHFQMVTRLAPLLPLKRLRRPFRPMCTAEMADVVLADLSTNV
jgi:hypothetical protein